MRKLVLEIIHRLPVSEIMRPYVKNILALTLKLLKTDNEDNVLVCLRIIIDLHKQYRPTFHPEVLLQAHYAFLLLIESLLFVFRYKTSSLTFVTSTQICQSI